MNSTPQKNAGTTESSGQGSWWPRAIILGCVLIAFIAIVSPRADKSSSKLVVSDAGSKPISTAHSESQNTTFRPYQPRHLDSSDTPKTAEEIVARKVKQFGRIRRDTVRAIALHLNKDIPPSVEEFFDALDRGNWDEIRAKFHEVALHAARYDYSTTHDPALDSFWRPVQEAFGAAEQAHLWPAQQLLDYGNAVLGSLRPGMAYVGGTDSGCFIPTMMNETSGGEQHIVLTQNGLADSDYLDYLNFLYGNQMTMASRDDSQKAFDEYKADAKKRYLHDQQFPDEPKQLKPGENVTIDDQGKVDVSGQTSVMAINELILQTILQKNPDLAFGLEESFPLKSTYADASTLGPIMELRASDQQNALTTDTANQSLAYWQNIAQEMFSDPGASQQEWSKAYAKLVESQGNLFAAHNLNDQAEQAYKLAIQLNPLVIEATYNYVNLLVEENRSQEALLVAQTSAQAAPGNKDLRDLLARMQNYHAQKN